MTQDSNKTLSRSSNRKELDTYIKIARRKILALMLLNGANCQKYGKLSNTLVSNLFTKCVDIYPKTIEDAIQLPNNNKITRVKKADTSQHKEEDLAFVQRG